jgi:16S rRNA (guanine527-N7)-methyltransferase
MQPGQRIVDVDHEVVARDLEPDPRGVRLPPRDHRARRGRPRHAPLFRRREPHHLVRASVLGRAPRVLDRGGARREPSDALQRVEASVRAARTAPDPPEARSGEDPGDIQHVVGRRARLDLDLDDRISGAEGPGAGEQIHRGRSDGHHAVTCDRFARPSEPPVDVHCDHGPAAPRAQVQPVVHQIGDDRRVELAWTGRGARVEEEEPEHREIVPRRSTWNVHPGSAGGSSRSSASRASPWSPSRITRSVIAVGRQAVAARERHEELAAPHVVHRELVLDGRIASRTATGGQIPSALVPRVPDLLATHRRLLEQWRGAMNLVGPGDVGEHYEDADRALAGLEPVGHWADLGSGAGFPGIVLAARFPHLQVDLVDSRRKRCTFLEQVLGEARVSSERVRVVCRRVEELDAAAYDGVTARAFAPPAEVLEHADRLLVPGGLVVLFLQADAATPDDARFEEVRAERYAVAGRGRRSVTLRRKSAC